MSIIVWSPGYGNDIPSGGPGNTAPTAANGAVSINEDASHVFVAADFNYSDADSDPLASVKITSLETAGSLRLNGVDVTLNQVISKANIDSGLLVFTPVANANGTPYATFEFSVNDGTDDSVASYTMTINVAAVNDAPVVDLNGASGGINASGTFTEGDAITLYLAGATLSDIDSPQLASLTLTCGGQWGANGPDEILQFSTWVTDADTDKTEDLVVGSTTFTLAYVASTGVLTVTKSGGGTFPLADGQALERLLGYGNSAEPPTEGDRTFTWVANDGTDNSTAAVLTVTVAAAPVETAPNLTTPPDKYYARTQTITPLAIANSGSNGTWTVDAGSTTSEAALNALGITVNASSDGSDVMTGTIDAGATADVYPVVLKCTNGAGSDTVTFDIDIRNTTVTEIHSGLTFPYYATIANGLYILTENINTPGSTIKLHANGIVLDLNGFEITYNDATPIDVVNGSFEDGSGAAATGWDFTNAPNAERWEGEYLRNETSEFGGHSIKFNDTTLNEYIDSTGTVTLEADTTYILSLMVEYGGYGYAVNPGVVMYASLTDSGTPVYTVSYNTNTNNGMQLVEFQFTTGGSPEVLGIRVGIEGHASATLPVYLDDVRVARSHCHGVTTSVKSYAPEQTPDLPTTGTSNNCVITNGTITQGQSNGPWCHGVFHYGTSGTVMDNLTITVGGNNSSAIIDPDAYTFTSTITNCDLTSNVRYITNRHLLNGSVISGMQGTITDNLVNDGPHIGINSKMGVNGVAFVASEIARNTISLHTKYTNGYAIRGGRGSQIHDNVILCHTGDYNARGIAIVAGDAAVRTNVYNNEIRVQGKRNSQEYDTDGGKQLGGVYGIQVEEPAFNCEVYDNDIYAYGNDTVEAYAVRANGATLSDVEIRNNNLYAIRGDAYVACYKFSVCDDSQVSIHDNNLYTDDGIVGASSQSDLTFLREHVSLTSTPPTTPHPFEADTPITGGVHLELRLQDWTFEDSTSEDYVRNADVRQPIPPYAGTVSPQGAFSLTWSTTISVTDSANDDANGATVVIDDAQSSEVANDTTDANGDLVVALAEFRTVGNTKTTSTPHAITVTYGSEDTTDTVTADQIQTKNIQTEANLVPFQLNILPTVPHAQSVIAGTIGTFTMTTANNGWAARFIPFDTRDIKSVHVHFASIATPGTITARIETVDGTTGLPTGTLYDAAATKSFTPSAGWNTITFDTLPTAGMTAGTLYALVLIKDDAGTTVTLNARALSTYGPQPINVFTATDASTRSNLAIVSSYSPICYFTLDDDGVSALGCCPSPVIANALTLYGADRVLAQKIVLPFDCTAQAIFSTATGSIFLSGTPAGDLRVRILNSSNTAVATVTLDKDSINGVNGRGIYAPLDDVVLAAGTYRIALDSPSSADASNCYYAKTMNLPDADLADANYSYSESTNQSSTFTWTDSADRVLMLGLRIDRTTP